VFEPISDRVAKAFDGDSMIDYMQWLDYKKNGDGPNIIIFAGQWDNRDGPSTIEPWIT